jgi:hypothetical protein
MPGKSRSLVDKQYLVFVIVILYLFFYLFFAGRLNVWEDETHTLNTVSTSSLKDLIRVSLVFEGQPPIYFILAYFWAKINSSVLFMRLLSTLLTLSSGLLIFKLSRKNSSNANLWILVLVFSNPYMLYLATEIRCYSLVVLLSILIIILFQKYYSNQNIPVFVRIIYIAISIAAVNTQYFVAFLLLSNGIFLLVKGYKKVFIAYLLDMIFVMLSLAWTPFFLTNQVGQHAIGNQSFRLEDYARFILGRLDEYVFFRDYFPYKIAGYIIEILVILTILIHLFVKRVFKEFIKVNFYYIFSIIVISICFLMIYPFLGNELLALRHTAILFPLIFLLFLKSVEYFQKPLFKSILIAVLCLFYITGSIYFYRSFIKDIDIHGCLKYMSGKVKADEPIVVFKHRIAVPFVYHFKGSNEIHVFPYPIDNSKKWDATLLAIPADKKVVKALLSKISEGKSFWVLNFYYPGAQDSDIQLIDSLIGKDYILEYDTILIDTKRYQSYYPVQIRKLKRNPNP